MDRINPNVKQKVDMPRKEYFDKNKIMFEKIQKALQNILPTNFSNLEEQFLVTQFAGKTVSGRMVSGRTVSWKKHYYYLYY